MEIGVLPEKLVTFSFLNLRISIHRTKMSYRNYHPLHRLMCLRGGRKEGGGGGKGGRKEERKKRKKEGRMGNIRFCAILTLYTTTSVHIFTILFSLHVLRYRQR